LVQITNLQSIEKMKDKIKQTDIYIKPDILKYGVISFDDGEEIIKSGEEAAFAVYEMIKVYGSSPTNNFKPKLKVVKDSIHINDIVINRLDSYTRSYVIGKLRFKQNSK